MDKVAMYILKHVLCWTYVLTSLGYVYVYTKNISLGMGMYTGFAK